MNRRDDSMRRAGWVGVCLLLFTIRCFAPESAEAQGVSQARYSRLTRGINMGQWFWGSASGRYGPDDLKLLHSAGVRFVRLPVGSHLLFDANDPDDLHAATLERLDKAIDAILAQHLAVMVCMFDDANKVWQDDAYAAKFAVFWKALAHHLSATDPEKVFLEVVNEPAAPTAEAWNALQPRLLAAMREGAPTHTLIAFANMRTSPDRWDNIGGLERLTPAADPNVIYNVHFFEPMTFTHQGATWGSPAVKSLRGVPYPSSPDKIAPLLQDVDASARPDLVAYGEDHWGPERVGAQCHRVAEWGKIHHVRVLCNEIGVYRAAAPADSRLRWLHDVRTALEREHIGWGMWEYDGGFGLVNTSGDRRTLDAGTARALGLQVRKEKQQAAIAAAPPAPRTQTAVAEIDADDPADEDRLNRELWESIKHTSYDAMKTRVERAHKTAPKDDTELPLPNGWKLAPAGVSVGVGRFPYEAIAYAGHIVVLNTGYYTGKDKPEISIVDPAANTLVRTLYVDALFPSAQVGADGDLYLSGGVSQQVVRINRRFEIVRSYTVGGYTGGLVALDATHLVVTYLVAGATPADFAAGKFTQGRLAILNTQTGLIEKEVSTGYFPYALQFLNGKLYVAVQGENTVQVFSPQLERLKTISVGRSPQAFASQGDRLYVVNANDDTVSIVDTLHDRVTGALNLRGDRTRYGGAPTSCALAGDRLYVTMTNLNAIAVFDTRTHRHLGDIPTGWYPTKALLDQDHLFALSAKGIQARKPNPRGPQPTADARNGPDYVLTLLKGALTSIPRQEIDAHLKLWTEQVKTGSPLLKPASGLNGPVRHIFYIVRENRTYDQVMGDIPGANGDPTLTLFGQEVTPNAHRLAQQFVTLDNYYADGEISVLGHSFTTSGYASPFLEWIGNAAYSGKYRGYPFGAVPAVTSPSYLWDALDAHHVDYRIYGENYFLYTRGYKILMKAFGPDNEIVAKFRAQMMTLASQTDRGNTFFRFARSYAAQATTPRAARKLLDNPDFVRPLSLFLCGDQSLATALSTQPGLKGKFAEYLARYPFAYRSWDLNVSDMDRAEAWKTDFEQQLAHGSVAQLNYLWLPNDHTAGAGTNPLPPRQLVAQNDAALGRIVETIANSPIWNESLILVTEDDAQNGPDHVDATRTVALAIGPSVKRGIVVHDRYDQLSMLRTIEVVLGLSPLHRGDALAVPMLGIFSATPDIERPPTPQPSLYLSEADRARFDRFDPTGKNPVH